MTDLDFPLRGEWLALRTPAARVPTHGTDFFGQRFAYDFVRPGGHWWRPFGAALPLHAWSGVPVTSFGAWNAPVHAAHTGRVARTADGWPDRRWVHAAWDAARLTIGQRLRPVRVSRDDWRPLTGNFVIVDGADGATLYAHLRMGSIMVRPGDFVSAGDPIGAVGHSGRSTMPHLHFQLMDRVDSLSAVGVPCGFRAFDRWSGGTWLPAGGVPGLRQRIRVGGAGTERGRRA